MTFYKNHHLQFHRQELVRNRLPGPFPAAGIWNQGFETQQLIFNEILSDFESKLNIEK